MHRPLLLAALLSATFLVTLPFGAWRAHCRKFSFSWWLAIHMIIPFIILMRIWAGFSYSFIPLFLAATVLGQVAGGRMGAGGAGVQDKPGVRGGDGGKVGKA